MTTLETFIDRDLFKPMTEMDRQVFAGVESESAKIFYGEIQTYIVDGDKLVSVDNETGHETVQILTLLKY